MRTLKQLYLLIQILIFAATLIVGQNAAAQSWAYDPGPDPNDPMQRELIDLIAEMPYMPGISTEVTGEQKFRLIFGPVLWRMMLKRNSMKILFIGQDATHIAEAAKRTATAGFGGRAQDLANYLGVDEGAGFINAYAYTIYGQAAAAGTPYIDLDAKDGPQLRFTTFVENPLWLMTYDLKSPVTQWRNKLIDWIIRYNRKSLRMIVDFGGAARDAIGSFIEERGGKVGSRLPSVKSIRVPVIDLVRAGGNNQFPVVMNKSGGDLYEELAGRKLRYENEGDQKAARAALENAFQKDPQGTLKKMGLTEVIHPGQLGGRDLSKIEIQGEITRSLKNLILSDGKKIGSEVAVAHLPHPTRLSMMEPNEASEEVRRGLEEVKDYAKAIIADEGFNNQYAAGKPYSYGRAVLSPLFYSFGTPLSREVGVSSAVRMSGKPHVIIFGTRDSVAFANAALNAMTETQPAEPVDMKEIFITRPSGRKARYEFDRGPGEDWARLMKENLNLGAIFKPKAGKSWKVDGIDAFNVKSHSDHGDFGHYRGTFENPRVLILADPDGADDLATSRALTGARGQYLHGLMRDLGIGADYLVLKTVPFDMEGADDKEWKTVIKQTVNYREILFSQLLQYNRFDFILTDGDYAAAEVSRIVGKTKGLKIVNIRREGLGNNSGIVEAGRLLGEKVSGERANIPRSHLTFYDQVWAGTSGDSVIGAKAEGRGQAYAIVAPQWAFKQKVQLDAKTRRGVEALQNEMLVHGHNSVSFHLKKAE